MKFLTGWSLALGLAFALAFFALAAEKKTPPRSSVRVPGPVQGTRLTKEYVRLIGRMAYLFAWPMVNLHNRYASFSQVPEPGLMGGIVPVAPVNQLAMLHDYIKPEERYVACPNQDVVYGFGILFLEQEGVIIQVPEMGDRFWVYQLGDQRTDSFGRLGKMYGSKPGFYLLVGPSWKGKVPPGVQAVFRSPTRLGYVVPRIFLNDTPEDRRAIQPLINQIMAYPLSRFTGKMTRKNWQKVPSYPAPQPQGKAEIPWVVPQKFFEVLPQVLDEVPPLPGEEALYAQVRGVLAAAAKDAKLKKELQQAALKADQDLVKPLFQFRHFGIPLPHGWTTITNGAAWGTDYYTRTAVARSNIFVNLPQETKYFYQDLDARGARLNGAKRYTVTFAKGQLPPVKGFWSLTLYDKYHFFAPNSLNRYSLGTKNQKLKFNTDGSLTLYVQSEPPEAARRANWLPAPKDDFSLYLRAYWPRKETLQGRWLPPAVKLVD